MLLAQQTVESFSIMNKINVKRNNFGNYGDLVETEKACYNYDYEMPSPPEKQIGNGA